MNSLPKGFVIVNKSGKAQSFVRGMTAEEKRLEEMANDILTTRCIRCKRRAQKVGSKHCPECLAYFRERRRNL